MDPKEENDSKNISWCKDEKVGNVELYLKYNGEEDEFYKSALIGRIKIEKEDLDQKDPDLSLKPSFNTTCKNDRNIDNKCDNDLMEIDAIKKELIEVNEITGQELNYCQASYFKSEIIKFEEVYIKGEEDNKNSLNEKKNDEEDNSNDNFLKSASVRGKKKKSNKGVVSGDQLMLNQCPQCPYKTAFKDRLKRHSVVHNKPDEIDWYRCRECNFKTYRKSNLKAHDEIHKSKEERLQKKVYQCPECPYKAFRQSILNAHSKIHMSEEERLQKRILHCPECSFKTDRPSRLQNHVLAHKSDAFKCSECSYQSRTKWQLTVHQVKHESVDKWHSCPLCPYKSYNKNILKRHQLTHDQSSCFQCPDCSHKTSSKRYLKKHQKQHQK